MLRPAEVTLIVIVCILSILVAFVIFKIFNLSFKVNTVSDFVNGEVFSTKFYELVQNYFTNKEYVRELLDPVLDIYAKSKNEKFGISKSDKIGEIFMLDETAPF